MERSLTLGVTSLLVACLLGWLGAWLCWWLTKGSGGNSDDSIAFGYIGILVGLILGILGFVLSWYLGQRFMLSSQLHYLQIVDGVILLMLLICWFTQSAQAPVNLRYSGHWAALEVETRINKSLLAGKPISSALSIDYAGGQSSGNFPRPEATRTDDSLVIVPWATAPFQVNTWDIRVFLHGDPVLFTPNLPKHPTQSTEWSGWIRPVQYQDYKMPTDVQEGLSLRYRFRLIRYDEQYY